MSAIIFFGVLALLVLLVIGIYNSLVTARNSYKNAFSQIDVQLQRRHDLIPNLVETAKGYLTHERETMEAVIAARGGALGALKAAQANPGDPAAMKQLASAEGALSGALGRLTVTMEAYPELKADATIRELSEELTSTENKIAFARQAYNDSVLDYNNAQAQFPTLLIARLFGFAPSAILQATENAVERQAVRIQI